VEEGTGPQSGGKGKRVPVASHKGNSRTQKRKLKKAGCTIGKRPQLKLALNGKKKIVFCAAKGEGKKIRGGENKRGGPAQNGCECVSKKDPFGTDLKEAVPKGGKPGLGATLNGRLTQRHI